MTLAEQLRAAIDAAREREPERFPSDAAVAKAAGILPASLSRALRGGVTIELAERVAAAIGAEVVVRVESARTILVDDSCTTG